MRSSFFAVALSTVAVGSFAFVMGAPRTTGAAMVPQVPPRMVGDVTRDGQITAADALAILSFIVGKDLPGNFIIDPDGDAACRANTRLNGTDPTRHQPLHDLLAPQITA